MGIEVSDPPTTKAGGRKISSGLSTLNQVIAFFTLAGDIGKWRKRFPLS